MRHYPLLAAFPTLWASLAFANPILPTPVPAVSTASYTGTLLASTSGSATAPSGHGVTTPFSVAFTEFAYRGGTGALCPTCINFVYSFSNTAPMGYNPIESMTTSSFSGYEVAAGYVRGTGIAGNGVAPTDFSINGIGTVTFDFSTPDMLGPGSITDNLVLFTNATTYNAGDLSFRDGTTLNEIGLGFAPATPSTAVTPEPSSLLLLVAGIVGIAGVLRKRLT